MKQRSATRPATPPVDHLYRTARKAATVPEDVALNALCDARLKQRRYPLSRLPKKLAHGLEK